MRGIREDTNRRMLRARDAIDRDYHKSLDVRALAEIAFASEAHFIRSFRATFGETPHQYLRLRRIERAMELLRTTDLRVGEICIDVGFRSVASFIRAFQETVGETPASYRRRDRSPDPLVPSCFAKTWNRPSSFRQSATPVGR